MLYQNGMSLAKIENKYGYSRTVVRRIFHEHNWEIRNRYDAIYNKYSYNHHYFDNIDNPNKAYFIGFLYADGYNSGSGFSVELQYRDKAVLYGFKNLLDYNGDIKFYERSVSPNNKSDTCKININGRYVSKKLSELGCVKNKSLILDFPDWITEELFPFFLKGYIDGDGWVQKYRIGLMSTDKFCNGVKDYLKSHYNIESKVYNMKKHYNEHTKTLDITNRKNIIPLVELMFSEATIEIPRKKEKYIEYGFLQNNLLSA